MIPCSLELGGNDVAIVCDDAPLPHTARGLVWGRMMNAGQSCVAPKRVLATPGIHAALVAALASEVRALRVGPGVGDATDVGPLIRPGAATGVRALVADAVAGGAQVVAQASLPRDAGEGVVPPMLLDGVSPGMRLWDEELFGPVLAVRRVASVEEAIALANAGPYGLSASVWSRDRRRARTIASRLAAGSVALNDVVSAVGVVELPHGGVGRSGHGRLHGDEALLECTRTRAVLDDVLPALRNPWWFGYGAAQREDIGRFTGLIHGRTLGDRLRGLMATLRLLRGYPSGH
jgi:succinate-semialdehyde dehydrogenase/glutarate-semialdehyde dehydrogenase